MKTKNATMASIAQEETSWMGSNFLAKSRKGTVHRLASAKTTRCGESTATMTPARIFTNGEKKCPICYR